MNIAEIYAYIKGLAEAGFEKRIMYCTDFMMWPRMIETSMGVIEHARRPQLAGVEK